MTSRIMQVSPPSLRYRSVSQARTEKYRIAGVTVVTPFINRLATASAGARRPRRSSPLTSLASDSTNSAIPGSRATSSMFCMTDSHHGNASRFLDNASKVAEAPQRLASFPKHPSTLASAAFPITPVFGRSDPITLGPREYAPVTAIPAGFLERLLWAWLWQKVPTGIRPIDDSAGGPPVLDASRARSTGWCPLTISQITMALTQAASVRRHPPASRDRPALQRHHSREFTPREAARYR